MKRLYLTVEGQTEQAFAVEVLQPHLATCNVFVRKPRLTGLHARRRDRVPQGGLLRTFQHSLGDLRRWLRQDRSREARFSIMVDLYSLPRDFPGYTQAMATADPYQRAETLEQELAAVLNDRRFIPYLQVHEFEALILSKPDAFVDVFEHIQENVEALRSECEPFATPEMIDDGAHTHPKARIKKHIKDYDENVDGPTLAADIGLATIRQKCPHFNKWLTILERLDRQETNPGEPR